MITKGEAPIGASPSVLTLSLKSYEWFLYLIIYDDAKRRFSREDDTLGVTIPNPLHR